MKLDPNKAQIAQLLITQERLLSKLYAVFAEQFPVHAAFWNKLSKEEKIHAELIEKLDEAGKKGLVYFDESKINVTSLKTYVDRLEKNIQAAQASEFTLVTALIYAADYESSLIEKNVFSHFTPGNVKAKNTLKRLQSATLKHIENINSMRQEADAT